LLLDGLIYNFLYTQRIGKCGCWGASTAEEGG